MRTILKNIVTGLYFQGVSDWTHRTEKAFDFQKPERAVRFVRAAGLNPIELELVFAFAQPRYNLSVPLDERFGFEPREATRIRAQNQPALAEVGTLAKNPKHRCRCHSPSWVGRAAGSMI